MKSMTDLEIINQLRTALQSTQHELATTRDERDRWAREARDQSRGNARAVKRIAQLERWLVESGAEASESLSNEQIAAVFGVMAACPQHTFQCLTKRAKRMSEWFEWATRDHYPTRGRGGVGPHVRDSMQRYALEALSGAGVQTIPVNRDMKWPLTNVWIGVSVEDQAAADERIPELLAMPAAVRFVSCEPLLGPVDLRHVQYNRDFEVGALTGDPFAGRGPGLSWVIDGCESGPGARPAGEAWFRSLRDQCAAAGVAYYHKQQMVDGKLRTDVADFPSDLRIQEFPE